MQVPNGVAAARYAGLVLEDRGTTLEDVFVARGIIEPPCARSLERRRTNSDLAQLKAAVEKARAAKTDPQAFIGVHNDFHELLIELAANETMAVLNGMLRDIIELSTVSHVAADAGSPANLLAMRKGLRAHERPIESIEARDAEGAETLWRVHLDEAKDYILSDAGRKTVLGLLG